MAQKRMFNKTVVNSDEFIEMSDSAQNLYFHLSMEADDDGFVDNWKSIMRMIGKKEDDLKILIDKKFVIPFETGVIVIRHWRLNNYIRNDRYKETVYQGEKSLLSMDGSLVYQVSTDCLPSIDKNRLDKIREEESSIVVPLSEDKSSTSSTGMAKANEIHENSLKDEELSAKEQKKPAKASKHKYGEYKNVLLKDEELQKLKELYPNWEELITYLDEYIEMKGYRAKSHYLCIRKWVVDAVKRKNRYKEATPETDEERRARKLRALEEAIKKDEMEGKQNDIN